DPAAITKWFPIVRSARCLWNTLVAPIGAKGSHLRSCPVLLVLRRLDLVREPKLCRQRIEAPGETLDVEIQGIVVAVGDLRVDGSMKCRNEPLLGTHAGDHV